MPRPPVRSIVPAVLLSVALAVAAGCSDGGGITFDPQLGAPNGPGDPAQVGVGGTTWRTQVVAGDSLNFSIEVINGGSAPALTLRARHDAAGSTVTPAAAGFTTPVPVVVSGRGVIELAAAGIAAEPGTLSLFIELLDNGGEVIAFRNLIVDIVRLALMSDRLHLTGPGRQVAIDARFVDWAGNSQPVPPGAATFRCDAPGVATVDADGVVTAVGWGRATISVQAGAMIRRAVVLVGYDYWGLDGWAAAPDVRTDLVAIDSADGSLVPTGLQLGGPSFLGGVASMQRHGDILYIVENAVPTQTGTTRDRILRIDLANTDAFTGALPAATATWLASDTLHIDSNGSAQSLAIVSPTKAYLTHLEFDADPVEPAPFLSIFNPTTMQLTGKVRLPDVYGHRAYTQAAVVRDNLLFVGNVGLDPSFSYKAGTIVVVDTETDTVVDLTPAVGAAVLTTGTRNPGLAIGPWGDLWVPCAGVFDWFNLTAIEPGSLEIRDPLDLGATPTIRSFGTATTAGRTVTIAPDGRAFIGSVFTPEIFSVDAVTRTVLRDATNPITLAGGAFSSAVGVDITSAGRLGAASGPQFYAFADLAALPGGATDPSPFAVPAADHTPAYREAIGGLAWRPAPARVNADVLVSAVGLAAPYTDPARALGGPRGGGGAGASTDVVEIGPGGSLTLAFDGYRIEDRLGPDVVVFSPATFAAGAPGNLLPYQWRSMTPGRVEFSQDGQTWFAVPASERATFDVNDVRRYADGFVGLTPTWAGPQTGIATSSWSAGGDRIDLAATGLSWARYIRLSGAGLRVDAVTALHVRQN
jgi:hypothetical protein